MANPQQPELARSRKTDLDPDRIGTELESRKTPRSGGPTGPVPAENQPGHHPDRDQDKPDLDAFAAKLSGDGRAGANAGADERAGGGAGKTPAEKAGTTRTAGKTATKTAAKSAAKSAKTTGRAAGGTRPAKGAAKGATKGATRPAEKPTRSPAPPGAAAPSGTPAKQPAGSPQWPEHAPARPGLGPLGVDRPSGEAEEPEPPMVGLALFPLRFTIRSLDRLERLLTERWRERLSDPAPDRR